MQIQSFFVVLNGFTVKMFVVNCDLLQRCSFTTNFRNSVSKFSSHFHREYLPDGIAFGFCIVEDASQVADADCQNYNSTLSPEVEPFSEKPFLDKL